MNAFQASRGRRLLLLLTICFSFTSFSTSAHADVLVGHLTDKTIPDARGTLVGRTSAQVIYRSSQEKEATAEDAEYVERNVFGALPALAVILVVPAGTQPLGQLTSSVPNPPPPPADGGNPPPDGGGHISGGGTPTPQTNPEPTSLILALTGSGGAALLALARRRRTKAAQTL